ncbi:MAG TPA: hypothetical protein VFZ65_20250 [Planctomycetota bacterium]|nr:hypothetical protein [Planctomycetota bacterium]
MRTALILAAMSVASTAAAQMPLPPFTNTYGPYAATRGFWFQAPTTFLITGLNVPNEAGLAFQAVEVVSFGAAPPPEYSVGPALGTQLFYDNSTPAGTIIPTAIPIVAGEYIGVLGACTPSVGSSLSSNSYAANGPFVSDILGIPTTITRFGTQFGIGAGGNHPCWSEALYNISRVEVYVSSTGSGTIATNTGLGQGCIRQYTSFYENFATSAAFDLANSSFQMISTGTGYVVAPGGTYHAVGSLGTPTTLALANDSQVAAGTLGLTVGSNCWVALGAGNSNSLTPTTAVMLSNPASAFYSWHDLNPAIAGGGAVKYEQSGTLAQITYDGVWDAGGTSAANANNIQYQIDTATGNVTICFGAMSGLGNGWLVGYSRGGASADPGNTDISATLATGVILTGLTDIIPLSLTANSRPVLGTNWNLTVGNVPATTLFGVHLFGVADPGILDLTFLGLPGCQLRSTLDAIIGPWAPTGATHSYTFPLPAAPTSLIGFELFTQAAVFQVPPMNSFGAITSGGIKGTLGNL